MLLAHELHGFYGPILVPLPLHEPLYVLSVVQNTKGNKLSQYLRIRAFGVCQRNRAFSENFLLHEAIDACAECMNPLQILVFLGLIFANKW